MSNEKLFSKFYTVETTQNEDKPKFRARILKYLEDFVRRCFPENTNRLCRTEMGINLKHIPNPRIPNRVTYCIEDTFIALEITDILDFISVVYDSVAPEIPSSSLDKDTLEIFIKDINRIFQEESMCYILHDNGRVRYYPDEEFHQAVKCTLAVLNKPKYADNLKSFNDVLDDLYKNHGKESPIHEFFKCVETFVLSLINDNKFKILNDSSVDTLMKKITSNTDSDPAYAPHDKEAASNIRGIFSKWVGMCHKYRHGKADQTNNNVPTELFNQIFSTGISIFRFLLEIDDKYNIKP
ncbi:MAG: hypothetical protein V4501_12820 [Pseudomonadota bacterium]